MLREKIEAVLTNVHVQSEWAIDQILDLIQESNKEAERAGVRLAIRTHHEQYPNCPEKLEEKL